MIQEIKADQEQIKKDFDAFLELMPPPLKALVDDTGEKFMYGAFLAGYRRGMSKTLAEVEKHLKK